MADWLGFGIVLKPGGYPADLAGMTLGSLVSSSAERGDIQIARKVLDEIEKQGAAAVGMIRDAAAVGRQTRGAVSPVPSVTETGQNLDVTA